MVPGHRTSQDNYLIPYSSLSPQFRIENISQSIAQKINAKHSNKNGQPWKDREPWCAIHIAPSLAQHRAPGRNARRDAETEKAQAGLRDNHDRHRESSDDRDARHSVRNDMVK